MKSKLLLLMIIVFSLSFNVTPVFALITSTHTNLTSWQTAVGSATLLEDFNSIAKDVWAPVTVNHVSISAVGPYAGDNGIEAYDPNPYDIQVVGGLWDRNIDGTTYYSGDIDSTIVTIQFAYPIYAFAWDYTSLDTDDYFSILGQQVFMSAIGDPPSDAFLGFVSDTYFNQFTFAGYDGAFGADNFRYTTPVPEPSTFILLGAGLAGLVAWRRKRS